MEYTHKTHRALKAGRELREWTQAEMAERMADILDDDSWTESRITAIENGRRQVRDYELRAFAEVQGFDVSFYWYGPPLLKQRVGVVPGYLNLVGDNPFGIRDNSKTSDQAARDSIRPRHASWFSMARDMAEKSATVIHTPNLFDDSVVDLNDVDAVDRWFDLLVEKQPA